jgi:hypothetical protein
MVQHSNHLDFPYQEKQAWIEQLALDETQMDELGLAPALESAHQTQSLLEHESLHLMESLRNKIEHLISLFNQRRKMNDPTSIIKIYKVSQTVNDFMCFRNSLKLIISRRDPSLIEVGIFGHTLMQTNQNHYLPSNLNPHREQSAFLIELKAAVGPFQNVSWTYAGEVVDSDDLIKYVLTEFIKNSAK